MRRLLLRLLRYGLLTLAAGIVLLLALVMLYRFLPPPVTPLMLLREGPVTRSWLPLAEIAPALPRAVVAAEDNHFCSHWGIDRDAFRMALRSFLAGETRGGGSTITQQTAKNLFLWPSRSPLRKGLEAPLAILIELAWSKQRILEVYLNIVEWAPGIYGAEAAAQHHFGKSAASLNRRESAQLAAVLPSPLVSSAGRPSAYIQRRAATIDRRVGQLGPLLDCATVRN